MKVGVLFSGGKDSAYALYKAMQKEKVVCLITLISKNKESYMFHTPNIEITELQAEAIGLPLIKETTKGVKEEELEDLRRAIQRAKEEYSIAGIVTGAIASNYQASRIQKICDELRLECINPLWGTDQTELLNEIVANKFKVVISGVFAEGLKKEWLGKEIDKKMIKELTKLKEQYKINPAGEGGEIESTVLDAPYFKKKIEVTDAETQTEKNSGVYIIKKARLADK